jgi:hypothetical protein
VVIAIAVVSSAGGVAATVSCRIAQEIQRLTGAAADGRCGGDAQRGSTRPEPLTPDVAPPGYSGDPAPETLVGNLEGVGAYESRGSPYAVRASFIKKLVCKIPGIKQICKWTIGRLEDEVVKACTRSSATCKKLVDKICEIGGKVCSIARELSRPQPPQPPGGIQASTRPEHQEHLAAR